MKIKPLIFLASALGIAAMPDVTEKVLPEKKKQKKKKNIPKFWGFPSMDYIKDPKTGVCTRKHPKPMSRRRKKHLEFKQAKRARVIANGGTYNDVT